MGENNEKAILDEIYAFGHKNVLGTHRSTIEITTEKFLTPRGNCIIATRSTKAVGNFSPELKKAIQKGAKIKVSLSAGPYQDFFFGFGNKFLNMTSEISIVFRLSEFISDRTALINCSKNAAEINRNLISYLQNPHNQLHVRFYEEKKCQNDELCLKFPENL
ncbi:hypothetical protein NEF87_002807 [Candidatus Lokiarchaeum ossiferum]|uniref:DUF371 domain-containing protein n=1 Tax=Candidatus Lokiarchaeum ossiferum TaxID=2951803 RepID=A0ABY6HVY2_9ARCH|nr:hypothetical protein NEF87_002807 [Candidatus Lokiarchaeum sp. B-35]